MGNNARVGFHAARSADGSVSSSGNALIGAYLYSLGITQAQAITYLTRSPPHGMMWITTSVAISFGITVEILDFSEPRWEWARELLGAPPHTDRIGTYILGVRQVK
jgi:hypothetical protein